MDKTSVFLQQVCVRRNTMGKQKKTRKFAVAKKLISAKDPRIKVNQDRVAKSVEIEAKKKNEAQQHVTQVPTAMFFQYNTQLGPPYHVLILSLFVISKYLKKNCVH